MGDTGSLGLGGAIAGLAVMTKTEELLIVLGGIFVVEALSVLIQVFSFQTFRKRVFLMAPVHHHFEILGWSETKIILRFWIVAAVCARSASRSTSSPSPSIGATRRPPLPPGPWLVVGLARSGIAALEVLRARGEQARGVDRRQGDDTPAALEHVRAVVKSPGVPAQAPVIAAARERGLPVSGRARARLAADPQRVHRGDRHQRQDDDHRADRPHPPRGRACRWRSPATSAPR